MSALDKVGLRGFEDSRVSPCQPVSSAGQTWRAYSVFPRSSFWILDEPFTA